MFLNRHTIGKKNKFLKVLLLGIFLMGIGFNFSPNTARATASWYNASWLYRNQITIDHTKIGNTTEDESNFPVMVSTSGLSGINTNGTDIRFTASDGTTLLPREIESYSSGTLVAWVNITTLSHTADTVIYMYYGNSAATEPAANSTYGSQAVWSNGFLGVWHLGQTGTDPQILDSTSNASNTTSQTWTPTTSGQIDGAGSFNGTNQTATASDSHLKPTTALTVSAWMDPTVTNSYFGVINRRLGNGTNNGYVLENNASGGTNLFVTTTGTSGFTGSPTASITAGQWSYISATYDGSKVHIYKNGTETGTGTATSGTIKYDASGHFLIGSEEGLARYFKGSIDEPRISSSARSVGWISTEYKNQNSPSTFYTIASLENAPTAPGAPTGLTPTRGNTQVALSWTTPSSNGGSAITDYVVEYEITGSGSWSIFADGVSTATTATVTGLTNGTSYDFRVSAVNAIGQGSASGTATATPATTPNAPTIGTATAGNAQASVTFSAPGSNGGSTITNYTVTSNPGGFTGTGSSSPITVTGLTNGTAYTFSVTATNGVGIGSASSASNSVTPATIPNAPTAVSPTVGNTQIFLSWSAPAFNGGSAITDYVIEYEVTGSGSWSVFSDGVSTATTATVTGLTNGTSYDFRVSAVNSAGQGSASSTATATPITVPGAPTGATAVRGNTQATISFTAPSSNGGSTITGYTVTSSPGGFTGTGSSSPIVVTGLTNGTAYTFSVTATNAAGTSSASSASNSVTPATVPNAPTSPSAVAGNAQATISFTAPGSNGGSTITGYTVTSSPGGFTGTGSSSPITVTGLTNGTAYTFTIVATNAVGNSSSSIATSSVTPITVPNAPTIGTATAGNAQASVTFTAPGSNGGSTITGYTVTSSPGGFTGTGSSSPITVTGLTNGTAYTFSVTATNAAGTSSASSASNSVTPATIPNAPTGLTPTAGNAQVGLSWTAPAVSGGANITDYIIEYEITSSGSWSTFSDGTSTATTTTVTGLTNGTSYDFRVSAVNSVGQGSASSTATATPVTVPGVPTIGTATAGNAQASVTFTAPGSNGGSTITNYTVTSNPGGFTGTGSSSPITVTGLTNGTAYTFSVTATNSVGTSSASSASNSVTPATIPNAPTSISAVAGNTQATISFTAPGNNGGATITGYTVTSNSGGFTGTGSSSPITVTGLTNGTAYTFSVTATNSVGTSSASSASNSVTPATIPNAPTGLILTAENAQVGLSWTTPSSNGGSSLTDYVIEYKLNSGSSWSVFSDGASTATTTTVTGLANGSSYDFRVSAVNSVGQGSSSSIATATPITVPDAPISVSAVAGNAQAVVSFSPPAFDGGTAITSYTVTSSPGNFTASGSSSPITVTGLTNGTAYTFTVTATNSVGAGSSSTASNSVTPITIPGAPTIGTATAGNAQASVTFTAPASNGGSTITSYTVTSSPGGFTGTGSSSPIVVTGLSNGAVYTFSVTATNAAGTGSASSASNAITPITVPDAPTIGTATAGNAQASVTFSAPGSNGGSTITSYTVTSSPGGFTGTGSSSPITVTGLTNGTAYTFTVTATNTAGTGSASASSNSVTPITIPNPPTGLAPTPGNVQVGLSWSAPAITGGASITDYVIEYKLSSDSVWSTFADGVSSATSATVTGLANGSSYDFRVSAVNAAGQGSASSTATATPVTVPGVPTIGTATAGNAQASVTFTAPGSNGGSTITGYTVTSSPGGFTGTGSSSPITVTGLTNGTAYTFSVTATNGVGIGSASSASNSVTPATIPNAPTAVSATPGNTQATISFTAPNDGGSTITSYTVTSSPGGFTGTGSSSPIVVTGLTNGDAYTFTVTATNNVGTSSASSASNSVTLATEPGAPTNLAATVLGSSIGLSWSAPASDGGSAINDYVIEYELTTGGTWSVFADGTSTATTTTVTGLSNNNSYNFRVSAVNAIGQSTPSGFVTATPGEPAQVLIQGFPDLTSPNIGTAVRITNEGSTAYEYQYTWCITDSINNLCGGGNDVFDSMAAKLIQPGANFDTTLVSTVPTPGNYWFHINVIFGSQSSSAYQSFTAVATYPDAPTIGTATASNAQASVTFTAPVSDGGSAITGYTVTSGPGGFTGTGSSSPIIVTGLTNGTAYTFTVTATNNIGTSSASSTSNSVTPATVPSAPTGLAPTPGNEQISLSWVAPTNNGGSVITDYVIEYKLSSDSVWSTFADGVSSATSATVTGLANGSSYDFRVSAVNAIGQSIVESSFGTSPINNTPPSTGGGGYLYQPQNSVPQTTIIPTIPSVNSQPSSNPKTTKGNTSKNFVPTQPKIIPQNEISSTPTANPKLQIQNTSSGTGPLEPQTEHKSPWSWIVLAVGILDLGALIFWIILIFLRREKEEEKQVDVRDESKQKKRDTIKMYD